MSDPKTNPERQPEEATSRQLEAVRRDKLRRLQEMGVDPWGGRFDDRLLIGTITARAGEVKFHQENGSQVDVPPLVKHESLDPKTGRATTQWMVEGSAGGEAVGFRDWVTGLGAGEFQGPKVRAAGRVVLQRDKGKLLFLDIQDWSGRIQLFVGRDQIGLENWELTRCIDLGDIVGVDGELRRTRLGELSIFAQRLHILCKSIVPPPEKHHGLTDPELRQRMRYLDLAYGDGVLERFRNRTKIVQSIRGTLAREGFCEVEGPTLHAIAGGAAARPFITHHNTLDMQLVLRIALELHLKRLLVGGMERVYELGRVYRNEGISPRHNPEFTMLEAYQAFGDYRTMMDLTERLIVEAIEATGGGTRVTWGDAVIDFTPPFARKTYDELLVEHAGVDPHDAAAVAAEATRLGFNPAGKHPDVVKNFVFEQRVEERLQGPVFVIDYPASICPLTKRKRENPEIAERFELYIRGMEIANAYTELNDPDLQEELFKTQLAGLPEEDSMARMDVDFVRALRHGMPPAGGLGVGIDRLVMLLTGAPSIRDVILFPLLRPEIA
jgi:lysyl-tRNA synthetase class 2